MKIYLASSWRNSWQAHVVALLRRAGHHVYDFKDGLGGVGWEDIDPNWESWDERQAREALADDLCAGAFSLDYEAMKWADAFVLLLPCNRSALLRRAGLSAGASPLSYTPQRHLNPNSCTCWLTP